MRYGRPLDPPRDAGEQEALMFAGMLIYFGVIAFVIALLAFCFWLVARQHGVV